MQMSGHRSGLCDGIVVGFIGNAERIASPLFQDFPKYLNTIKNKCIERYETIPDIIDGRIIGVITGPDRYLIHFGSNVDDGPTYLIAVFTESLSNQTQ